VDILQKINGFMNEKKNNVSSIEKQSIKDEIGRLREKMKTAKGAAKQSFKDEMGRLQDRLRG
jgi:hypothetical protein